MEKKKLNLKKIKVAKLSTLDKAELGNIKGGDCFYSVIETSQPCGNGGQTNGYATCNGYDENTNVYTTNCPTS